MELALWFTVLELYLPGPQGTWTVGWMGRQLGCTDLSRGRGETPKEGTFWKILEVILHSYTAYGRRGPSMVFAQVIRVWFQWVTLIDYKESCQKCPSGVTFWLNYIQKESFFRVPLQRQTPAVSNSVQLYFDFLMWKGHSGTEDKKKQGQLLPLSAFPSLRTPQLVAEGLIQSPVPVVPDTAEVPLS